MAGLSDGEGLVARLMADPPRVHPVEGPTTPDERMGLWGTERACYELIASRCRPGMRTLETGLGLSTALFAALGTRHTCIVPFAEEADRLFRYCAERGIPTDGVELVVGWSDELLPALKVEGLQVFLIDGSHGFPHPTLDWYYGAPHLELGGLLVVDDRQLPAVRMLTDFLDRDPRWGTVSSAPNWAAYERLAEGGVREDWWEQPFVPGSLPPWHPDFRRPWRARLRSRVARARRRRKRE